MKKHILLIDGNSLAHANHNGPTLTVGGVQVQAIFGVLKSLRALLKSITGEKRLIVLWDGKAYFRLDLFPDYKGNRAPMNAEQAHSSESRKKQMPVLEKALSLLGVPQLRSPLLEADDLAGYLIPMLVAGGHQVTMVSGDQDWLQMVGTGVSWFDPIRDRSCDETNFLDFTGYFTTKAFVHGKALQGDGSDNIPGVGGLGEKGAAVFMAKWKDVFTFFDEVDKGTYTPAKRASKKAVTPHPEEALASPAGRELFIRNLRLMDWSLSRRPNKGEVVHLPAVANPEGFEQLCARLNFQSILRELTQFLETFNITYSRKIT